MRNQRRIVRNRLVIKFGGDALATIERIIAAAHFIVYLTKLGYEVVVVVSAMGQTTDDDLDLIGRLTATPDGLLRAKLLRTGEDRSAALLALAINAADPEGKVSALAPDTHKAGLLVTDAAGRMEITGGRGIARMERLLARRGSRRTVLVFSGFQGVEEETDEVTTLGRGASDLSAVCFAKVFAAEMCILCKRFPGIAAVDPRIVSDTNFFGFLTYDQYLDVVTSGVVQRGAVEAARRYGVPIRVCLSPSIDPSARGEFLTGGTLIAAAPLSKKLGDVQPAIAVLNVPADLVFLEMPTVRAGSAQAGRIYGAVGRTVSLVEEHELARGMLLAVRRDDAGLALRAARAVYRGLIRRRDDWVMLTLADRRMSGTPGYVHRMRQALRARRVPILGGWSAGHQIIRIIPKSHCDRGVRAIANEFGLRRKTISREMR